MNPEHARIIAASDDDRCGLFAATARWIGTTEQNIENDFRVCRADTAFTGSFARNSRTCLARR
jgi:hypothetical protein